MDAAPAGPDAPETLVRLAAQGNDAAFARIVRLYRDDMVRVAFVVCGGRALAEEATALAWPTAWRRLGSLRSPDRLRPWLCSIAAGQALELIGRRQRRRGLSGGSAPSWNPTDTTEPPAADPALLRVLGGLDPAGRALLALRYVAGCDLSELARAAGLSPAGARSRVDSLLVLLARDLGGAGRDATSFEPELERRLRVHVSIPVPPLDAVSAARDARAAMSAERVHLVSVVVALLVAAAVLASFYFITLQGEGGVPGPTPTPTLQLSGDSTRDNARSARTTLVAADRAWVGAIRQSVGCPVPTAPPPPASCVLRETAAAQPQLVGRGSTR